MELAHALHEQEHLWLKTSIPSLFIFLLSSLKSLILDFSNEKATATFQSQAEILYREEMLAMAVEWEIYSLLNEKERSELIERVNSLSPREFPTKDVTLIAIQNSVFPLEEFLKIQHALGRYNLKKCYKICDDKFFFFLLEEKLTQMQGKPSLLSFLLNWNPH